MVFDFVGEVLVAVAVLVDPFKLACKPHSCSVGMLGSLSFQDSQRKLCFSKLMCWT